MMNFKHFEQLYGAAEQLIAEAKGQTKIVQPAKKEIEILLKEFAANFPETLDDAKKHPEFDCEQFFALFDRWPELLDRKKFLSFAKEVVSKKEEGFYLTEAAIRIWKGYALNPQ